MTPRQLLEIKPGITVGNVIAFVAYIASVVAFGIWMRADINAQLELIIKNSAMLHEHLEITKIISDKQIDVMTRLQIAENNIQQARDMGERLKGIETSLIFIVGSIKEIKSEMKGVNKSSGDWK